MTARPFTQLRKRLESSSAREGLPAGLPANQQAQLEVFQHQRRNGQIVPHAFIGGFRSSITGRHTRLVVLLDRPPEIGGVA